MNHSGKVSKKILYGVSLFLGVILLAAVAIPLFVDVDSYRPKIVSLANEKINGQLELGKLSLSLWGQIRINVDGMKLSDAHGQQVLGVKEVYFHLPFFSLFGGAPELTFKMFSPELVVVKNKAGKLNVFSLVKEQPKSTTSPHAPSGQEKAEEKKTAGELPSLVKNARLGIEMKKARLTYRDETADLSSEVKDLNVLAKDISLSGKMEVKVTADLDTKMGKTLEVKGPVSFTAKMAPKFNGSQFESSDVALVADLNGIEIQMPGTFHKKSGLAMGANAHLAVTADSAEVKECVAHFFNAEVKTTGQVKGFSADRPTYHFQIKTNSIDLKAWNELLPTLKMKSPATLEASAQIATETVEHFSALVKAPGNDLKMVGKVVSFTKPKVDVSVTSSGLDLDSLIDFPPPGEHPAEGAKTPSSGDAKPAKGTSAQTGTKASSSSEDLDALLDPLRSNPIAKDTVANVKWQIASVKAKNVRLSDVGGSASFKGLVLQVEGARLNVFSGKIAAGMQAQLAPKTPTYRFNLQVDKLDLQKAVESQFAMFKNTLVGLASFKMEGNGASFNTDSAKRNLTARGHFEAENATFATIDIGKTVVEAINRSLDGVAQKVPALKGKTLGAPANIDSRYSLVSSDFTIAGGKFVAPNFVGKAVPNKGLDLKGETKVGMIDLGLEARWEVIDTYNLTKARDLSVEYQGIKVEHLLADSDGAVHIPIQVGGTCAAPQVSYLAAPEALGKVALNNSTKALTGKAKAEARKKVEEVIQKQAPPQVQEALKKFGGKLFGN